MRRRASFVAVAVLVVGVLGLFGCRGDPRTVEDGGPEHDGGGPEHDGGGPELPDVLVDLTQTGASKVDVLFVIDNSGSMLEEQAILAQQIQNMVQELIAPTPQGDETPPSVEDLHIGIITTDLGTGGQTIMTCPNPFEGDNGILQNTGRYEGCDATYTAADCPRAECPWLVHSSALPDDGSSGPPIWEDFGCVATLGTGGCDFEQHLESSLLAVTTQMEPGRPNEGFLRPDSLLAIIYVTDEDDCSAEDPEIFNPSREDLGPPNVRCALREDMLHPVRRYYDAFVGLRPGMENQVIVAAITGVPVDGSWNPGDSIDALRDLQMPDPNDSTRLLPSCDTANGLAFPPVRIAELVYMFENNGILESICRNDWTQAFTAITQKIQSKLIGPCMSRSLISTDPDVCRVIETLIDNGPCPHLADASGEARGTGWHVDLGLHEAGMRQCEILPADYNGNGLPDRTDGGGDCDAAPYDGCYGGWFYTTEIGDCRGAGTIAFTSAEVTSDLSDVRFECFLP